MHNSQLHLFICGFDNLTVCVAAYPVWLYSQEVAPLPQFSLAFVSALHTVHTHTHTLKALQTTLREDGRPCRLTQKLLILLSAAMNDLPISELRNEFNTNNESGRIL